MLKFFSNQIEQLNPISISAPLHHFLISLLLPAFQQRLPLSLQHTILDSIPKPPLMPNCLSFSAFKYETQLLIQSHRAIIECECSWKRVSISGSLYLRRSSSYGQNILSLVSNLDRMCRTHVWSVFSWGTLYAFSHRDTICLAGRSHLARTCPLFKTDAISMGTYLILTRCKPASLNA